MKTHLLQDPRKYFIPEKRQLQLKKALLSSLLPCLVSCHRGDMILNRGNHFASMGRNITAILEVADGSSMTCVLDTGNLPV